MLKSWLKSWQYVCLAIGYLGISLVGNHCKSYSAMILGAVGLVWCLFMSAHASDRIIK